MIDPSEYVSIAEAARLTGVSRQALHDKVARGRIPHHVVGGHRLIRLKDLYEYVENPPPRKTVNIPKGEAHHNSKLTEDIVRKIRKDFADGKTQSSIAAEVGIAAPTVWMITSRRAWKHVE